MINTNLAEEVFQGLPVEHCPLCGELISIEKSEIIQSSEINCEYCRNSILAYLPKHEGQLFFTKECNNCEKMNNTRSRYCVYCGHNFSVIRKRFQITITKFVAYVSLALTAIGTIFMIIGFVIMFTFTGFPHILIYVGSVAVLSGLVLGIISFIDPKARPIARISLIISSIVDFTWVIFVVIALILLL
ncbi:MAG: hypothetical protein E3J70_09260 [Candidatus Heimdallarchaeota archaeon]|nr:MAG: hypothetical protein E3J70_09260 [Candidatus Heimdallarchaeota archaeon]